MSLDSLNSYFAINLVRREDHNLYDAISHS